MRLTCFLRQIRLEKGLTLTDIEDASGVSRGTLSKLENGRELAADAHVEALEHAYGVAAHHWYPPAVLLQLQRDDEAAAP